MPLEKPLSATAHRLLLRLANSERRQLHRKRMLPDVSDFRIDGKPLLEEAASYFDRAEWDVALAELLANDLVEARDLVRLDHKVYELTEAGREVAGELH